MIRALVFDLDGLMLDTESALIDAYAEVYARHGVPFEREAFLHSVGQADYTFDPWHAFDRWADRAALEIERRDRGREIDRKLTLLPGVADLLDAAEAAGLGLGVASNSRHEHVEGHLRRLGILGRFQVVGCREDVPSPKPEPDLYRYVVNRLGVSAREAVAFEDSHAGSLAAKRAGLWVVAAPNVSTAHHDFDHVDWKVPALTACTLTALRARFEARDGAAGS